MTEGSSDVAISSVAYVVDGDDDASVAFAARLMEKGVHVRGAEKPFTLDSVSFARGSIVVQNTDNRDCGPSIPAAMRPGHTDAVPPGCDLHEFVVTTANELGLAVHSVGTGQGVGDLPDLGGSHFKLLERPQIATIARDGVSSTSFGSIWHAIDTKLGIRHSQLDGEYINYDDIRRYNVIILPAKSSWDESFLAELKPWIEHGGTLIAVGRSAFALANAKSGVSQVRTLRDVLGSLDDYELAIHREWQGEAKTIPDVASVFSYAPGREGPSPWDSSFARPDSAKLAREDSWRRIFMPGIGAPMIVGRTNPEQWLTFGTGESISVLFSGDRVLMAKTGVEAAVRAGVLTGGKAEKSESASAAAYSRIGWSSIPAGRELIVRQSGLLWPEASRRIANTALVTRESVGNGQVILFAFEPTFRGTLPEDTRVLLNAIVLGPGFGADAIVEP